MSSSSTSLMTLSSSSSSSSTLLIASTIGITKVPMKSLANLANQLAALIRGGNTVFNNSKTGFSNGSTLVKKLTRPSAISCIGTESNALERPSINLSTTGRSFSNNAVFFNSIARIRSAADCQLPFVGSSPFSASFCSSNGALANLIFICSSSVYFLRSALFKLSMNEPFFKEISLMMFSICSPSNPRC